MFLETWRHLDAPESLFEVEGFSLICADRSEASGKDDVGSDNISHVRQERTESYGAFTLLICHIKPREIALFSYWRAQECKHRGSFGLLTE